MLWKESHATADCQHSAAVDWRKTTCAAQPQHFTLLSSEQDCLRPFCCHHRHPFVFVVVLLLLPLFLHGQLSVLHVAGVVIVAALIPLGLFMRQRYTSGWWQTVDASARADRPVAYLAGFTALVLGDTR